MTRLILLAPLVMLTNCGALQVISADITQRLNKCLAQDPQSPFVVEWAPEKHATIEDIEDDGIVIVSYDGCNTLKVLDGCKASGGYRTKRQSVRSKTITITNEAQLWSKLPLGAAGLKGHLAGGNAIELKYVLTGMKKAKREPAPHTLQGECSGATHFISKMYVGAFEVRSGTASQITADVSAWGIGAGGAQRQSLKNVSQNGNVTSCKSTGLADGCKHTIRLKLKRLVGTQAKNTKTASVAPLPKAPPRKETLAPPIIKTPPSVLTANSGAQSTAKTKTQTQTNGPPEPRGQWSMTTVVHRAGGKYKHSRGVNGYYDLVFQPTPNGQSLSLSKVGYAVNGRHKTIKTPQNGVANFQLRAPKMGPYGGIFDVRIRNKSHKSIVDMTIAMFPEKGQISGFWFYRNRHWQTSGFYGALISTQSGYPRHTLKQLKTLDCSTQCFMTCADRELSSNSTTYIEQGPSVLPQCAQTCMANPASYSPHCTTH